MTVDGRNALNQSQLSNRMNIKSIAVGDGNAPGNFSILKGLVHQLYEITNLKIDVVDGKCTLTADFPKVDYDYYFREVGVVVATDTGDKLYVYDNCGDDAQHMVYTTGVESTQKRIRLSLYIDDVAQITVSNPSILYVGYDDYEKTVGRLEEAIDAAKEQAAEDLDGHVQDTNNPHKITAKQLGLDPTSDMDKPVSIAQQAALDALYQQMTAYTQQKIADLINGAPTSLDTLKEVADAIAAHKTIMDALDAAIGKKASVAEFDSHVKDTTKHIMPNERTAWNDKMETTGDSANNTTTFTSGDEANPTGWADIGLAASGEKHSSLMRKFSLSIKNVRYLWKLLGSTSLSGIGDGTVTGAINALNTGLQVKTISVTPNTDYLSVITGKRIGSVIIINFISEWKQWNPGRITVGNTNVESIAFMSREAMLIEGQSGSIFAMCNINVYGRGNIEVVIPDEWQAGKFAHLCGTIVFLSQTKA